MSINFLHFPFTSPDIKEFLPVSTGRAVPSPKPAYCRAAGRTASSLPHSQATPMHVVGAFRRFRMARHACQNDRLRTRREPGATRAAHHTDTATRVSVKYQDTLADMFAEPAQVEAPGTGKASAHDNLARAQVFTLPRADKAGNAANTGWNGRRSCAGASGGYQDLQVKRLKKMLPAIF